MNMKKSIQKIILLLALALISSSCFAQVGVNGVVGMAGPINVTVSSGTSILWNDSFSASQISTETWCLTQNIGASKITQNGDGFLYLAGGGPADIYTSTFQPQGISRGIYGDFTVTTKMVFVPTENYQQAGLMACDFTTRNSTIIGTFYNNSLGGINISRKDTVGGTAYVTYSGNTMNPIYLKMVRSGTSFSTYYSSDGSTWTLNDNTTKWSPPTSDHVQLWVYNIHTHTGGTSVATATFDYVNISRP